MSGVVAATLALLDPVIHQGEVMNRYSGCALVRPATTTSRFMMRPTHSPPAAAGASAASESSPTSLPSLAPVAPRSVIYCAPRDAEDILKVDLTSNPPKVTHLPGPFGESRRDLYKTCMELRNKVYCPPYNGNVSTVLEIDPENDLVRTIAITAPLPGPPTPTPPRSTPAFEPTVASGTAAPTAPQPSVSPTMSPFFTFDVTKDGKYAACGKANLNNDTVFCAPYNAEAALKIRWGTIVRVNVTKRVTWNVSETLVWNDYTNKTYTVGSSENSAGILGVWFTNNSFPVTAINYLNKGPGTGSSFFDFPNFLQFQNVSGAEVKLLKETNSSSSKSFWHPSDADWFASQQSPYIEELDIGFPEIRCRFRGRETNCTRILFKETTFTNVTQEEVLDISLSYISDQGTQMPFSGSSLYLACGGSGWNIYCAPWNSEFVVRYDTRFSLLTKVYPGFQFQKGGESYKTCAEMNNKVFCAPWNAQNTIRMWSIKGRDDNDIVIPQLPQLSDVFKFQLAKYSSCTASYGRIFCAPGPGTDYVYMIEAVDELQYQLRGAVYKQKCYKACASVNQRIFCPPDSGEAPIRKILYIDASLRTTSELTSEISFPVNGYDTCVPSPYFERIICAPGAGANKVLDVSVPPTPAPSGPPNIGPLLNEVIVELDFDGLDFYGLSLQLQYEFITGLRRVLGRMRNIASGFHLHPPECRIQADAFFNGVTGSTVRGRNTLEACAWACEEERETRKCVYWKFYDDSIVSNCQLYFMQAKKYNVTMQKWPVEGVWADPLSSVWSGTIRENGCPVSVGGFVVKRIYGYEGISGKTPDGSLVQIGMSFISADHEDQFLKYVNRFGIKDFLRENSFDKQSITFGWPDFNMTKFNGPDSIKAYKIAEGNDSVQDTELSQNLLWVSGLILLGAMLVFCFSFVFKRVGPLEKEAEKVPLMVKENDPLRLGPDFREKDGLSFGDPNEKDIEMEVIKDEDRKSCNADKEKDEAVLPEGVIVSDVGGKLENDDGIRAEADDLKSTPSGSRAEMLTVASTRGLKPLGLVPPPNVGEDKKRMRGKYRKVQTQGLDPTTAQNTVWPTIGNGKSFNMDENFQRWFLDAFKTVTPRKKGKNKKSTQEIRTENLGTQRRQNISIIIKNINLPRNLIETRLSNMEIKPEQIRLIDQLFPTETEVKQINETIASLQKKIFGEKYDAKNKVQKAAATDKLPVEEAYMSTISDIPDIRPKVRLISYMNDAMDVADEVAKTLEVIHSAVLKLTNAAKSGHLKSIIGVMLKLVNMLNESQMTGFRLSTLTKFKSTKMTKGKGSLMDVIVMHAADPNTTVTVEGLVEELSGIEEVCLIEYSDIKHSVNSLNVKMQQIKMRLKGWAEGSKMVGSKLVEQLQTFYDHNSGVVQNLKKKEKAIWTDYLKLCEYFIEKPGKMEEFFKVFTKFRNDFVRSWREMDEKQERMKRQQMVEDRQKQLRVEVKMRKIKKDRIGLPPHNDRRKMSRELLQDIKDANIDALAVLKKAKKARRNKKRADANAWDDKKGKLVSKISREEKEEVEMLEVMRTPGGSEIQKNKQRAMAKFLKRRFGRADFKNFNN